MLKMLEKLTDRKVSASILSSERWNTRQLALKITSAQTLHYGIIYCVFVNTTSWSHFIEFARSFNREQLNSDIKVNVTLP